MKQKNDVSRPLYLQLYEILRDDITAGVYPYGGKLPSKRTLSERYGMSVLTVEHTLSLLTDEGYIEPRQRSGYYVCYSENETFARPGAAMPPPRPHTAAGEESGSFSFSVLAGAMRRVISDYGEALTVKTPNTGAPELREAISKYLRRSRGMQANAQQIVIGAGAEYLYSLLVQTLGRDKAYAIENPSYEKIEAVYNGNGVAPEMLALGPHGIRSAALAACKADVLHITPYRSFPSGVTASASKRREYLRWASGPDRYIVEDDYESEFSLLRKVEETVFAAAPSQNVIYLNTFTRTVSPSVRVGYMVLPLRLVPEFTQRLGFYSCSVPAFEQYVLAELINSGDFERHINRIRRNERRRVSG
jgi:GntR family transcriptional regulator/MocR family aminotransferase